MKITKRTEIVQPAVAEVKETTYTLVLSEEELRSLAIVQRRVGGSTVESRRKHFDQLCSAINEVAPDIMEGYYDANGYGTGEILRRDGHLFFNVEKGI